MLPRQCYLFALLAVLPFESVTAFSLWDAIKGAGDIEIPPSAVDKAHKEIESLPKNSMPFTPANDSPSYQAVCKTIKGHCKASFNSPPHAGTPCTCPTDIPGTTTEESP